jgi:hypothetical protein
MYSTVLNTILTCKSWSRNTQSTYIPRVPQWLSSRPNWDPHPPSPVSECVPPPGTKGGTHSPAGGGIQFGRLSTL